VPPGLAIVAVPPREDPRDVLVGPPDGLNGLPSGARVATGSPRREAQLRAVRPDLAIVPIRGNVGTRLDKLARGEADALVLAAAGLRRLGLWPDGTTPLPVDLSTPAPGQGLLAVEAPADGAGAAAAAEALDDRAAHACLRAERSFLAELGGGCMRPLGALCEDAGGGSLRITAFAGEVSGGPGRRTEREGPADDPEGLGRVAAAAVAPVRR